MDDKADSGKRGPDPKVSDEEITETVEELGRASTAEVNENLSESLDHSRLIRRLKPLADDGEIVNYRPSREHIWMSHENFDATVGDIKFQKAIENQDAKIATTDEIAEYIGCDTSTALRRLRAMEEEGKVASKGTGDIGDLVWTVSK